MTGKVLALSGGVGGAKLARGLSQVLAADQLLIVANTGDDFEHLGLTICPDLDSVLYALAGVDNQETGWGVAGESWRTMAQLAAIGGPSWFRLGDLDLATHLQRTALLAEGLSLSDVTQRLCRGFGLPACLLPMSDQPVRTWVSTVDDGELPFQHYFVARQCEPVVTGFRFEGSEQAEPHPQWLSALQDPELRAVVICPSNPFVSVGPLLALPGVRAALQACPAPIVAVSPIVAGTAIKGPAAKMMRELAMPSSALAIAEHYAGLIDGLLIDSQDAEQLRAIRDLGMAAEAVPSVMRNDDDKQRLARDLLALADRLRDRS